MKAIVWTKYGSPDGLKLREVAKPTPGDHEVLIRVRAATVTAGDCEVRSLKVPPHLRIPTRLYVGLFTPQRLTILGQELAGEIEAVGKDVTRFKPGDQVFGTTGFGMGAYAEYKVMPAEPQEEVLITKPANLSFEEAAAVPTGGMEALYFLSRGHIQPGEKVLIVGAGGSIGTFGVQLAKYYGAEVTGVDSTGKLDMLRAIGADHVIDFTREDYTRGDQTYDVIFDVIGKSKFGPSLGVLKPGGRYLLANPRLSQMIRGRWVSARGDKRVIISVATQSAKDLAFLKELIEAGTIKPILDRTYPLEETAEAHRYAETGQKKGHIAITVAFESAT